MRKFLGFLCFIIIISFVGNVNAVPVQWEVGNGGNGHWYDYISNTNISWTEADTAAEGLNGHLITITNEAEQNFFWDIFTNVYNIETTKSVWLGGYRDDAGEPWQWVTGEAWSYTNWYYGEPNDQGYNENYLTLHGTPANGMWNDQDNVQEGSMVGYFVEYDSAPVPEPATMFLLGSGLVGLVGFRKKFKK